MRIGKLAESAGCRVETVRYYEREGLLPGPERSAGNYRVYAPEHAERLAFIRRCRSLDMSLPEIRTLLKAIQRPDADCRPVDALLKEHIGNVSARIAELRQLKSELNAIRAHCKGAEPTKRCGIITSLVRPALKGARTRQHVGGTHDRHRR